MDVKALKRFKTILEQLKHQILASAKKTLIEEASFDTDNLPERSTSPRTSTPTR